MISIIQPQVGQVLEFDYPAANYSGVRRRLEPRRFWVESVRDIAKNPLTPRTLVSDPRLLRGNLLITGTDLNKLAERSFYWESVVNVRLIADNTHLTEPETATRPVSFETAIPQAHIAAFCALVWPPSPLWPPCFTLAASPWQSLMEQFLSSLAIPIEQGKQSNQADDEPGPWRATWLLLVQDTWFQEQLDRCARRVLRNDRAARQLLEDVKQQALLVLARDLRRTPDLHVDRVRVREHFPGWLRTILTRDCQQSLRCIRRLHSTQRMTLLDDRPIDRRASIDARIDLDLAIDQLDDTARTIVRLHLRSLSVQEIADSLGLSYWKTYRTLQRSLTALRSRLSAS